MPLSDTVNNGVELALFEMLAVPDARLLLGSNSREMGMLGALEKPAP
jgi:hypothetical protein